MDEDYTLKAWESDCGPFSPQDTITATNDCQVTAVLQKVEEEPTPTPETPPSPTPSNPQTKDCNGQQIPIDEDCPAPQPQTKDCHGQVSPMGDTCRSLLVQHANGVTIMINPML